MRKKKLSPEEIKKAKIQVKNNASLSLQIAETKKAVTKHKKNPIVQPLLLGAYVSPDMEGYCNHMEQCVFFESDPNCKWLRENNCATKCKIRTVSNRSIGVDGGKIKYFKSKEEVRLLSKINKGLRQAQAVEDMFRAQELKLKQAENFRKWNAVMKGIKELLDDSPESDEIMTEEETPQVSKYAHLTSLV